MKKKILLFIKRVILITITFFAVIFIVGEPIGEYTIKIIILKILSFIWIYIFGKANGL